MKNTARIEEHQVKGLIREWLEKHPEHCGLKDGLILEDCRHPYLNTDYEPARWEAEAYNDKATYLVCIDVVGNCAGKIHIEYQGSHHYRNFENHRKAMIMANSGYSYNHARRGIAEGKYDVFTPDEWDDIQYVVMWEDFEKGGDITGDFAIVTYWI